jgi:hypothetical protein
MALVSRVISSERNKNARQSFVRTELRALCAVERHFSGDRLTQFSRPKCHQIDRHCQAVVVTWTEINVRNWPRFAVYIRHSSRPRNYFFLFVRHGLTSQFVEFFPFSSAPVKIAVIIAAIRSCIQTR